MYDYLHNIPYDEMPEAIERLIDDNEKLEKDFITLKKLQQEHLKEIARLNNIISELEKWLEERKGDISFAYYHTLNKIKELKGNDKE